MMLISDFSSRMASTPILAQRGQADFFNGNTLWLVILFATLIVSLAFVAIFVRYFRLWIQSVTTGAGIGILRSCADVVTKSESNRDYPQQDHGCAGGHLRQRRINNQSA